MMMRIVTDVPGLTRVARSGVEVDYVKRSSWPRFPGFVRQLATADVLVMANPGKYVALGCLLARLFSSKRLRLIYYDVLIPVADGLWRRLARRTHLELLRRADLILTVHADQAEYRALLKMPEQRLRYTGFKSNSWEDTEARTTGCRNPDDGAYVLACGRSYRDFATFSKAMARTGLPSRILLPGGSDLIEHGTIPPGDELPSNVQIVRHDGTRAAWLEAILGARIVVVPLRRDVIQPAGVSVYLEAMNLCRSVVITEGASTRGMLNDSMAGIVPAGDVEALAKEVLQVWKDPDLRAERIERARAYVETLGGVERMSNRIVDAATALFGDPH